MSIIHWDTSDARLKTYAVKTRAKGGAVISLEIEVEDARALGWLMRQIEEIRAEQDQVEKATKAAEAEERAQRAAERQVRGTARKSRQSLPAAPHPLLLTYERDGK
ncbi:hypothetical protein [Aquabacter cavernae]|uniref:hypothetical protein n=1 Tax=Aquabacter cavernae TaxID=2496029 RepID=UPI000F8C9F13|nr:hypothetical protein [Aquabacter cavernae]